MTKENKKICIAKILTAHGVRGLVKFRCFLEDAGDLEKYNPLTTESGKTYSIHLKNRIKGDWVAEVENITDRNEAEKLRGLEFFVAREALPEAEDGVYYEDLIGLETRDASGQKNGRILAVENFGAGDLIEVQPLSGKNYFLPLSEPYAVIEEDFVTIRPEDFA